MEVYIIAVLMLVLGFAAGYGFGVIQGFKDRASGELVKVRSMFADVKEEIEAFSCVHKSCGRRKSIKAAREKRKAAIMKMIAEKAESMRLAKTRHKTYSATDNNPKINVHCDRCGEAPTAARPFIISVSVPQSGKIVLGKSEYRCAQCLEDDRSTNFDTNNWIAVSEAVKERR